MKKILSILIISVVAIYCCATPNNNWIGQQDHNKNDHMALSTFNIMQDVDALTFKVNNVKNFTGNVYYTVDNWTSSFQLDAEIVKGSTFSINDLKAGDIVALYFEGMHDQRITGINGNHNMNLIVSGYKDHGHQFKIHIKVEPIRHSPDVPSGQPLPGVLATLLIGCCTIPFAKRYIIK